MDVKPTSIMNYDLPPRYLDDGQNNDKDWKMEFDVAPECPKDKPYLRFFLILIKIPNKYIFWYNIKYYNNNFDIKI